jgi:glutaredoxin-related protein
VGSFKRDLNGVQFAGVTRGQDSVFKAKKLMLKATHYSTMLSLSDCPGCSSLRKEVETLKENYDAIKMKVASLEVKYQIITIHDMAQDFQSSHASAAVL